MRYKALAKRFRQALGVKDPVPAAMLLPETEGTGNPAEPADPGKREFASEQNLEGVEGKAEKAKGRMDGREVSAEQPESARNEGKTDVREFASVSNRKREGGKGLAQERGDILREAREEAKRLLGGCEGSCVSLMAVLAIWISPDYAPRDEGGMRKAADRMADAKTWNAEERKRIARAKRALCEV